MQNIFRLTAAINKVNAANPPECLGACTALLSDQAIGDADITVFPRLSLSGPSCGNLFRSPALLEACADALSEIQSASQGKKGYVIVGFVMDDGGKPVSAMAVLHQGELIGVIPTLDNPPPLASGGYSRYLLPIETVFACGGMNFCIVSCSLQNLGLRIVEAAKTGCDLILVPAYSPAVAGQEDEVTNLLACLSRSLGVAIAVVNGGVGDTSSPYVYRGFASIFECGTELAYMQTGSESASCTVDIDLDVVRSSKRSRGCPTPFHSIPDKGLGSGLFRPLVRNPFIPAYGQESYLTDLFELQVRSLAARMENIGVSHLVLGVSGGLDSTAALLAAVKAVDNLGLPRENIIGVVMPGFGTSEQTRGNAHTLIERLGVSLREISIAASVTQHFADIGHNGQADIVYENAQARERTQILFDIANTVTGIVVGTGDLSEEALGFCTFGGDHLSGYNVNVCVSKTTLRQLIWHLTQAGMAGEVKEVVTDILNTPVSPELLPLKDGEIAQRTEELLGPYELHDFFLYHFIRFNMRPSKILAYAVAAFPEIEPGYIRETLIVFIRRFIQSQFKRACAPDSASITQVNLNGVNFYTPSDLDPTFLLEELGG
ncbi:MAG: NAD(+) synthase [Oscillospiraceae bacterium]|nr:NAD(+) synthase [Oscillospiraceae bacterium]